MSFKVDMLDYMIDESKGLPADAPIPTTYYDSDGRAHKSVHKFTLAKKVATEQPQYFVAEAADGSFFNPAVKEEKHLGLYKFRRVNKVRFELYVEFLKKGDNAKLRVAERKSTGE